jgi:lipopolysaccharide export system permease protein
MLTTFDRYLLGRLLHTYIVLFVAAYGLYIVIDLFTNIDEFQDNTNSNLELFARIAEFYSFRAFEFFALAGTILVVLSVITVLGLLQKHSETFPILAAGIPAFRLLKPLLLAAAILNAGLIVNQEFIIPNIAGQLQTPRGSRMAQVQKVDPVYDYSNHLMHIDGEQVLVESQTLMDASFTLPEPELATQICVLKAEKAMFASGTDKHPSGWLLQNLTGVFDPEILTPEGRRRVIPRTNGKDVFIVSEVSFDQLYNRGRNLRFLSSLQLVQRIQNPSTGPVPVRGQSIALHFRLTQPLLCLLNISMVLPLVFRKESQSLITNLATCTCVLGLLYALTEGCLALGTSGLISPDLAAWLPVIITGVASTWTSGLVQT